MNKLIPNQPQFSNRKDSVYFNVEYTFKINQKSKYILTRSFRTKSKNKKNAILQAKKDFKYRNQDFINKLDSEVFLEIIEVVKTDMYFHKLE